MAFLNNDGQFTDESLSLLMRDLRGFITATENEDTRYKNHPYQACRPSRIAISEPVLRDPKQILEDEYVKCEELCKGCSANHPHECRKDHENDICWYKAHQHAKALLESLSKLV